MSYRRIEINLLPPELQPGPVVRSALIINITLILATFFTIGLTAALSLYRFAQTNEDIKDTKQRIKTLESVRAGYEQLQRIDAAVLNYGKVVGIASTDYIDMPVLLSHLSTVVPDGVYVTSVTNTRSGNASAASVLDPNRSTLLSMTFRTSKKDLNQLIRTLDALKADSLLGNCALTNAILDSEGLNSLADSLGMDILFSLPDNPEFPQEYNFYEFVIRAEVRRPLEVPGSRIITEDLELFRASKPMPLNPTSPAPLETPGTAAAGEPGVIGGPEGVTGTPNRGGN